MLVLALESHFLNGVDHDLGPKSPTLAPSSKGDFQRNPNVRVILEMPSQTESNESKYSLEIGIFDLELERANEQFFCRLITITFWGVLGPKLSLIDSLCSLELTLLFKF